MKRQVSVEVEEDNPESLKKWAILQNLAATIKGDAFYFIVCIPENCEAQESLVAAHGDMLEIGRLICQAIEMEAEQKDSSTGGIITTTFLSGLAQACGESVIRTLRAFADRVLRDTPNPKPPEDPSEPRRGPFSVN